MRTKVIAWLAAGLFTVTGCNQLAGIEGATLRDAGGDGPDEDECAVSADCIGKGQYQVCRVRRCVSLLTDLCTTVHSTKMVDTDAYLDESALFLGSILPTVGVNASSATMIEDSIKLALDDFGKVNGIPSPTGGSSRPIVLLGCNDGESGDRAADAADHLVKDLGIQAIIGPVFSSTAIQLATSVTVPNDVLLFSPSATSNDLTQLPDKDLVWRTSSPDTFQAAGLALYYASVEASAKKRYPMIEMNPIKVAIVHTSDSHGAGLADALQAKLVFNGLPAGAQTNGNYRRFDYGTPHAPDLTKVPNVASFAPHVVFALGFHEAVDPIFVAIESQWSVPTDGHRAFWVFSSGGQVAALWEKAVTSEDLRTRVTGTVPGVNAGYLPYANFRTSWFASPYQTDEKGHTRSPDTLGPAGAYDITYMLAYSAVAVGKNPLTGRSLVDLGLRRMVPGANVPKVTVGPAAISDTFTKVTSGKSIDIEGTSGPLDFNEFGEAPSDVQVWCVPKGNAPAVAKAAIYSGRYYDYAGDKMAGTISAECGLP